MPLTTLSFFSGAMGLDLGLEAAGLDVRLTCESDAVARKTIAANRPGVPCLSDVTRVTAEEVRAAAGLSATDDVFLMAGGPPCQAFSTAGRRLAFSDRRGDAFVAYLELALELRPRYLLIENVRGLLSAALRHRPLNRRGAGHPALEADEVEGSALACVLERLEGAGYAVSFELYNAANFGVPQSRERVVLIAAREGGRVPYLVPTHASPKVAARVGLPAWRTLRDALQTEPPLDERGATYVPFPEKRLRFFRMVTAGQNWRALPAELQHEAIGGAFTSTGGRTGFIRRVAWDAPSPTLLTHPARPATDLGHPTSDRPLSVQEYLRLQQFPDDYVVAGSVADQYRQLGNAVPVGLGKAAGAAVLAHYRQTCSNGGVAASASKATLARAATFSGFRFSRYRGTDDVTWRKSVASAMAGFGKPRALACQAASRSAAVKSPAAQQVRAARRRRAAALDPCDSADESEPLLDRSKWPTRAERAAKRRRAADAAECAKAAAHVR